MISKNRTARINGLNVGVRAFRHIPMSRNSLHALVLSHTHFGFEISPQRYNKNSISKQKM